MKRETPKSIAQAILRQALLRANREWMRMADAVRVSRDPMPDWAEAPPAADDRPDAKVIALFPQPDGSRCACETWGRGACRIHREETRS